MTSRLTTQNRALGLICVLTLTLSACRSGPLRRPQLRQDEMGFRRTAKVVVHPEYPAALVSTGVRGVAVADVLIGPDGTVDDVSLLEAPHPAIESAMRTALQQWRFPTVRVPDTFFDATVRSKVTYYFSVANGRGIVRAPDEEALIRNAAEAPSSSGLASPRLEPVIGSRR